MRREDFMRSLNEGISPLPYAERKEITEDYVQHFEQGLARGESEEIICAQLGDPRDIAKDYLDAFAQKNPGYYQTSQSANAGAQQATVTPKPQVAAKPHNDPVKAVLLALVLIFVNLVFILPLFISLLAVLFSLIIVGISGIICGLCVLVAVVSGNFIYFFIGLMLISFFVLFTWAFGKLFSLLCKGIAAYARANVNVVKGVA